MNWNTIARTLTAVILSLGAVAIAAGPASATERNGGGGMPFTPPYATPCSSR